MDRDGKLALVTFLTLVRFPLVLVFFVGALINSWHPQSWLFAVSLVALVTSAATDLFDGMLARKFEVQTTFGAHADPLMDKFFYLSTLPLLVFLAAKNGHLQHGLFLLVLTLLFLARDQWVTFLRSMGAIYRAKGNAHWTGKVRTSLNFPLICCIYYLEDAPWGFLDGRIVYAFEIIGLTVNMLSLWIYTQRYWPYLVRSARVKGAK